MINKMKFQLMNWMIFMIMMKCHGLNTKFKLALIMSEYSIIYQLGTSIVNAHC